MLVLGINKILNWCQITSGGRTYTCPTKLIDGKLVFHFKKEWHSVAEFVSDHAEELVSEGGKIFSRPFKKEGTEKVDYTVYIWYNVSIKYRRCFYDRTTAEIDAKSIHGNI